MSGVGAPSSAVDICNLALDRLGQRPIDTIELPSTDVEVVVARHYEQMKRALLRQFLFNFAKVFKKLNATLTISAISKAAEGVVTFDDAGPIDEDKVYTFQGVAGMTNVNGKTYKLEIIDDTETAYLMDPITADLHINTSTFGTYTSGGTAVPDAGLLITGISKAAAGGVVTFAAGSTINEKMLYAFSGVAGMTEVNSNSYYLRPKDTTDGTVQAYLLTSAAKAVIDTSGYTTYTSGGVASPGVQAVTPAFGYDTAYLLPGDNLRLLALGDTSIVNDLAPGEFDLSQGHIFTDYGDDGVLDLTYVQDVKNVALFDPLFIDVLWLSLANRLAYKYTVKPSLKAEIEREMKMARAAAASACGQEKPPRRIERSRVREARRFGYRTRDNRFHGG